MKKVLLRMMLILLALFLVVALTLKFFHGQGDYYQDISGQPVVPADKLDTPILLPFPPGMITSSKDGRIFYTYHPFHRPDRFVSATLFEWVDGESRPFPSVEMQQHFKGAMGITVDRQNRLWVIKPGALEGKLTELLAVDATTGELILEHSFNQGEAGYAQDLRVSKDGKTVFLADTGLFKFVKPSLLVFDVETQTTRTLLKGHSSVSPQNWLVRKTDGEPHRLAFGLITFAVGVDGIALSGDDKWLYYATMSHDSMYRIPTEKLLDDSLSEAALADAIEYVGHKPLSDGIELLVDNTVIITDIENGGLAALSPSGVLSTLTKDSVVDWADSVTVAPNGDIWFTDSRLTDLIDQFAAPSGEKTMREKGPYKIWRIRP